MGRMQNDMFLFFVVERNTFLSRNNPEGLDRSGRFVFSVYLEVIIGTWVWGRNVRDGIILSVVNLAVSFREAVFHTPGLGLNRNLQTAIIIARIGHLGRKPGALFHLFCLRFLLFACRTGSSLLSFGGFNIQLTVSPALWSNTSFMVGRVLRDYAGTGCWNQVRKNCSCWWGQHFLFLWPSSGSPPPGTSILPPIAASEE